MGETTRTFQPCIKAYLNLCGCLFLMPVFSFIIAINEEDTSFYWMAVILLIPVLIALVTYLRYRITIDNNTISRRALWSGNKIIEKASILKVDCIREQTSRGRPMILNIYTVERQNKLAMGIRLGSFSKNDREELAHLVRANATTTT